MQRLGKYEIVSEIGRGAMGAVYKAKDPLIGRLVALKTITSGLSAQANSLERFYQEARSAGALQHPHIVTIYELGQENNTPFIAMEFIEGGSLDSVIEQRLVLPLSMKLGYIVHVCEALSYAHGHNVVHRDIKPGNIMVTKEGVVKVVDFGIARLTDMSLTQPNMMIGSRAYMSPQLYKGERADARADIWALGVTLYELLAYRRPFTGENEAELMYHIISDNPPDLKSVGVDCSDELAGIIRKMLEKKADERYQSMEDVLHDLEPLWRVQQQSTVAGLLTDCQQLIAANDLQRAQGQLRKALQIDMGNSQAKSMLEKVTAELRRSQLLPKLNEHLGRGRSFLENGKLREARGEAEAALGLDSRHEVAQRLFADVEAAAARAQEVEQKLRLTKQRLAEGALTEAAVALGQALELDRANAQAQELQRQIDEERNRREKRKKLGELLHHARTLWTALNYEDCLKAIADGLKEFPDEPELLKLQEMTRHDVEELQKQKQLGEARKLLGQEEFAQARKLLDALAKKYPQDSAIKNLQTLAVDGQREQERKKKFAEELTALRAMVSGGKLRDAVNKGDVLLREYPEEFELKELVAYVRGEITAQEQKLKEKDLERRIQRLIEQEKYGEAEHAARRAAQEFPKQEAFRALAVDAAKWKLEQEERERTRLEMQQRIKEIGKREADQNRKLSTVQTLVEKGDFAGATLTLNQAVATKIFDASDARLQQALQEIARLSTAAPGDGQTATNRAAAAAAGTVAFSATMVGGSRSGKKTNTPLPLVDATTLGTPAKKRSTPQMADSGPISGAIAISDSGPQRRGEFFAADVSSERATPKEDPAAALRAKVLEILPRAVDILKRPVVLAGIGAAALAVLVIVLLSGRGASKKEILLRAQATQLWSEHQLDESERAWQQLQGLHGKLQKEANQHVSEIEERRSREQERFDQGMAARAQDVSAAKAAFEEVQQMNLWHVEDANRELAALAVPPVTPGDDPGIQEKSHFDRGEQFFQSKNFDLARKEFLAVRELNVANSVLRPEAEKYLRRIKQTSDDKSLFDGGMQDIKTENWGGAQDKLQQLVERKSSFSNDAKQKLGEVTEAQKAIDEFTKSLQSEAYGRAKSQADAMLWPKTQAASKQKLQVAQRRQLEDYEGRSKALQDSADFKEVEHLQDDVRRFAARAEDATVVAAANDLDNRLGKIAHDKRQTQGDKDGFDAAVAEFFSAKQRRDANLLGHEVMQKFQKIARESGMYSAPAQVYVVKTIPNAIAEITKASPKLFLPPLECTGAGGAPTEPSLATVSCAQLDAGFSLQWADTYTVDFPESANQPGKLPYTLKLMVIVDPTGKVKVDKDGNVDKDFLKKAKDASKNWKTTVPKSGGKPVSVKFPLAITFRH